MPTNDKWAPRVGGIRDPRDTKKKNGMFHNWPRFLYFGGAAQGPKLNQDGSKKPSNIGAPSGGNAVGPISDRGKGR